MKKLPTRCDTASMDAEWFIPVGYVVSVALKVLLPPHPSNKFIQLLEAECQLFERMVPCPTIQQAPIVLNPNRISAIDEMRMKTPADNRSLPNASKNTAPESPNLVSPAAPVEMYG